MQSPQVIALTALTLLACSDNTEGSSNPADAGEGGDAVLGGDAGSNVDAASPARCSTLGEQPRDDDMTVASGGRDRVAAVHVPASYDPTRATPVVLNFHGYSSSASQQAALSRMIAKSDAEGFIAVHATGIGGLASWNGGACCGTAAQTDVDDVQFVSDMIDELAKRVCVDPARVFATGLSNGGFLSHRLACELAPRIAAVGPVAGVLGIATCNPSRPVPVMHFHGTADGVVPYTGNPLINYGDVEETLDDWAERNGCTGEETSFDEGSATCVRATGCAENATVTLCTISGGGHTWPGGVTNSGADISATDELWDFFATHPHPDPEALP